MPSEEPARSARATGEIRRTRDTLTTGELRLGRRMSAPAPTYEQTVTKKNGKSGSKIVVGTIIGVLAAAVLALSAFLVVKEIQNRDERSPYASEAVESYLDTNLLGSSLDDARILLDALASENETMPLTYRVVFEKSTIVPKNHVMSYRILMQDGVSIVELRVSR